MSTAKTFDLKALIICNQDILLSNHGSLIPGRTFSPPGNNGRVRYTREHMQPSHSYAWRAETSKPFFYYFVAVHVEEIYPRVSGGIVRYVRPFPSSLAKVFLMYLRGN
jgi:hypothetical protein